MASIDSLPPDQRAVLQLVLQRGRSYDDIAQLLSIDQGAVRQRAHSALDALGPQTRVDPEHRAEITDYLLGQQTDADAAQTRELLASSASERAWARVVASELGPLATGGLPEIPTEGAAEEPAVDEPVEAPAAEAADTVAAPEPAPTPRATRRRRRESRPAAAPEPTAAPAAEDRPVSRRGGALLIGAVALVVVIVVIIIVAASGGNSSKNKTASAGTGSSTTTTSSTSTGTSGSTGATGATALQQFKLTSPSSSKTLGIAVLVKSGSEYGIEVVAQDVTPNTKKNAYAVWLYNSPTDSKLLGFVYPGVTSSGKLETAGPLPANANSFRTLLVTVETQQHPTTPGPIVLEGTVSLDTTGATGATGATGTTGTG
jgi:Sigma-70, region 4